MLIRLQKVCLCLLAIGFVAALGRFAYLRFSSGDLYPRYSTLRTDPFGTKALLESLKRLDSIDVQRHFEGLDKIEPGTQTTIFFLGCPDIDLNSEYKKIEDLVRHGSRVILAFDSQSKARAERNSEKSPEKDKSPETPTATTNEFRLLATPIDSPKRDSTPMKAILVEGLTDRLPASLPWNGRTWIKASDPSWENIYVIGNLPVVLRKKIGLGALVLVADTFLFSNEALLKQRSTEFLLWTVGGAKKLVFDEAHLGLLSGQGIAVILRQYRLHGLFAGLFLLAALWIWKNGSSLVPAYPTTAGNNSEAPILGKASRQSIIHLLERNISLDQLPALCLAEWEKSNRGAAPSREARLKKARESVEAFQSAPPKTRNPLQTYLDLCKILSPKSHEP